MHSRAHTEALKQACALAGTHIDGLLVPTHGPVCANAGTLAQERARTNERTHPRTVSETALMALF